MFVSEGKYADIKEWADYCSHSPFIAKKTGIPTQVVNKIINSKSYEDYEKRFLKAETSDDNNTIQMGITSLNYQISRINGQLKIQSEALTTLVGYFRENTRILNELYNLLNHQEV